MTSARALAAEALLKMEGQGAYSNLLVDQLARRHRLPPYERRLLGALVYGVTERRLTLDHCIAAFSSVKLRKIAPRVLTALRLGVYQLLYLDHIPPSAAVDESVTLCRQLGCGRSAGFVNGVLRAFLRAGGKIPAVQGDLSRRWEVAYSCPAWLCALLAETYGAAAAEGFLQASLGGAPLYVRANTARVTPQELCTALEEEGVPAQAQGNPEGLVLLQRPGPLEKLAAFRQGLFHVQDRASQLAAAALAAGSPQRILDLCGAPGGKAFTLAQMTGGQVISCDLYPQRAALIAEGARRLGLEQQVSARVQDALAWEESLGQFDGVLCDVPCSGLGVIRRKPEIKYKPREELAALPEIQLDILTNAGRYLAPGGVLLYSTCTLLPEENRRVVEAFLAGEPQFRLLEERTLLGGAGQEDSDGFYYAKLTR